MNTKIRLTRNHPLMKNHKVFNVEVLPGLSYIDMIYQMFRANGYIYRELELRNLTIYKPLLIGNDNQETILLHCHVIGNDVWQVTVERSTSLEKVLYATAKMHRVPIHEFTERLDLHFIQDAANNIIDIYDLYKHCSSKGLVHTGIMQATGKILVEDNKLLLKLSVGDSEKIEGFMFHPALIDASGLGVIAFSHHDMPREDQLFLPICYESFRATDLIKDKCIVRIKKELLKFRNELSTATLEFFGMTGEKIGELSGLSCKVVRDAQANFSIFQESSTMNIESSKAIQNDDSSLHICQDDDLSDIVENFLRRMIAQKLDLAMHEISSDSGYFELGLDSAGLLSIVKDIDNVIKTSLSPTLLFEYTTPRELTNFLVEKHREAFEKARVLIHQEVEDFGTNTSYGYQVDSIKNDQSDEMREKCIQSVPSEKVEDNLKDIAIIGLAGQYPNASNMYEFWGNLLAGKDCISEIPVSRWDWKKYDNIKSAYGKTISKWGGFLEDPNYFDPQFFKISPREAQIMDPQERLFLQTCWEAIEDAGYTPKNLVNPQGPNNLRRVGVFAGVMHKDYTLLCADEIAKGKAFPFSLNNASIPNRVSYFCNFHGPSMAIDTVCSSSLTSVHLAVESLKNGECEVALAGGVNVSLHPDKYISYGLIGMHSSDGYCRSFGEGGDGYVSSEGVGAIVLKPLNKAIKDGDNIYATIKGSAINHGGTTNGMTVPSPVGQSDVIMMCLDKAGVHPRTVSYIEAHGTGTSLGDPVEIEGLMKAFGFYTDDKQFCSIGSVKSNVGHTEGAGGICGLSKVILQLYYKKLVPSLHSDQINPYIDFEKTPFYLQKMAEEWKQPLVQDGSRTIYYPRRAGVSAFAASGSNAHIILEEYSAKESAIAHRPEGKYVIVPISARNNKELKEYCSKILNHCTNWLNGRLQYPKHTDILYSLAYTMQVGREAMEERIALVVNEMSELIDELQKLVVNDLEVNSHYRGNVKKQNQKSNASNFDSRLISRSIENGDYHKMAELWTKGAEIDWKLIYHGKTPKRLSLPTYPFKKDSYSIYGKVINHYSNANANANANVDSYNSIDTDTPKNGLDKLELGNEGIKFGKIHLQALTNQSVLNKSLPLGTSKITLPLNNTMSQKDFEEKCSLKQAEQEPTKETILNKPVQRAYKLEQLIEGLTTSLAEALYMDVEDIDIDATFIDLGLDSIVGVEWMRTLNAMYRTSIAAAKIYEYPTIRKFAEYLEQELNMSVEGETEESIKDPWFLVPEEQGDSEQAREGISQEGNKGVAKQEPIKEAIPIKPVQHAYKLEQLIEGLATSLAEALYMDVEDIDIDATFIDLGLDSIVGVEWMRTLNAMYRTSIAAAKIYEYPTIRKFAEYLEQELNMGVEGETEESVKDPWFLFSEEQGDSEQAREGISQEGNKGVAEQEPTKEAIPIKPVQHAYKLEQLIEGLTTSLAEALYMDVEDIDIDATFIDLGLDSIVGVEWMRTLNAMYRTSIAAAKIYEYPTIRKFAEYLEQELNMSVEGETEESIKDPWFLVPEEQGDSEQAREGISQEGNKGVAKQEPIKEAIPIKPVQREHKLEQLIEGLATSLAEALYMDVEDIDIDATFIDLGLDSIVGVEWMRTLNAMYRTSIAAAKIYEYPTIRKFAEYLEQELNKPGQVGLQQADIFESQDRPDTHLNTLKKSNSEFLKVVRFDEGVTSFGWPNQLMAEGKEDMGEGCEVYPIKTTGDKLSNGEQLKNNCYIILDKRTKLSIVVDPAWEIEKIINKVNALNSKLVAILLTHSHNDHVNLTEELMKYYNLNVYMSRLEVEYYNFECNNLSTLNDMDEIIFGDTRITCLLTPGHTAGGMCFLLQDSILTGDTIFVEGCGVCHLKGGSPEQMYNSIQKIKKCIPHHVKVYPGHSYGKEPGASIDSLMKNNLYFQLTNLQQFTELRMRANPKSIVAIE
ncbi:polyketide synthase dehydratase domain-containing protein [Paenibacillus alba]|uniref:beta-ketoacyl synthase N-terminal-like domain-containing protein n=1 Tax=Paenibacillus alba TaxID=1197127 RepID=UPI001563DA57|nr:beta-ketoacyl synthase N-terminal-like domain-containing protein [Paenibacillus alba]NQX71853.1 polyketide synthase dehydratase domain-containing protein [Paenibacillus alba]